MQTTDDRYIVRLGELQDRVLGFGEDLDEAIAYATDAAEAGVLAEVWSTGTEEAPGELARLWPEEAIG
jgi:hypothetical protein